MKSIRFLTARLLSVVMGGIVGSAFGVNPMAIVGPLTGFNILNFAGIITFAPGTAFMGLTVTDLITEFGAYYLQGSQNVNRVLKMMMQPAITEQYMTLIKTDDTIYQLAQGKINDLLQPFQKAFTPKGGMEFKPNEIRQYHVKVDDSIYPDDIVATWLGFLSSSDLTRKDWPLVRFIIENYYLPKIKENLENKEIFKGIFAAPTPGVAGATGSSMNGLGKMIKDGLTAGTINNVPLGVITKSNIFDKVEEFVNHISELYQGIEMCLFMSKKWEKAYLQDKRSQGFYFLTSDNQITRGIDFTPQSVQGLPSMNGTNVIFATPKDNLLYVQKNDINKYRFNLEEQKREVFFLTDWWEGVGFGINEVVWAYDPSVTPSSGSGSL